MKFSLLSLVLLPVADAFTAPIITYKGILFPSGIARIPSDSGVFSAVQDQDHDHELIVEENTKGSKYINSISAITASYCLLGSEVANAAGPDWGKIFRKLLVVR